MLRLCHREDHRCTADFLFPLCLRSKVGSQSGWNSAIACMLLATHLDESKWRLTRSLVVESDFLLRAPRTFVLKVAPCHDTWVNCVLIQSASAWSIFLLVLLAISLVAIAVPGCLLLAMHWRAVDSHLQFLYLLVQILWCRSSHIRHPCREVRAFLRCLRVLEI